MNVKDNNHIVLSYWYKSPDSMNVFEQCQPHLVGKVLEYTFGTYHAPRDRTVGIGLNVYDGKAGRQAGGSTVHRHGKDCFMHEYYSQTWNHSLMPMVATWRNHMVTKTSQVTRFLNPLQLRLLDIGSGLYDTFIRTHHEQAKMSLMTGGYIKRICGFCNGAHMDLNDKCNDTKDSFLCRLSCLCDCSEEGKKRKNDELPKSK